MEQLTLTVEESAMDAAFWKYHKENPEVFNRLVAMTRQAYELGRRRLGMKMLFEVIRWEQLLDTTGPFKLNNSYTSRYVRIMEERYPELGRLFEKRRIKS